MSIPPTQPPKNPPLTATPCAVQMLVIAFHEFGHAIACVITGGHVKSISLDPREGGVTHMQGGRNAITLPAGYLGSSLIGALLTFAGFNINASKIASIVVGVCFLLTLWWGRRDWLTIGTILAAVGLLVGCWFIAHAEALRFVVLFIGVMSSLYSVWDIVSFFSFVCVGLTEVKSADWTKVRRPHPAQGQQLRRVRFCQAIRRIVAVLGRHLVHHLAGLHGRRHRGRHRRVPAVRCPAEGGLAAFHPHQVLGPRCCISGLLGAPT